MPEALIQSILLLLVFIVLVILLYSRGLCPKLVMDAQHTVKLYYTYKSTRTHTHACKPIFTPLFSLVHAYLCRHELFLISHLFRLERTFGCETVPWACAFVYICGGIYTYIHLIALHTKASLGLAVLLSASRHVLFIQLLKRWRGSAPVLIKLLTSNIYAACAPDPQKKKSREGGGWMKG